LPDAASLPHMTHTLPFAAWRSAWQWDRRRAQRRRCVF